MQLTATELEIESYIDRQKAVNDLERTAQSSSLILDTCQRLEIFTLTPKSSPSPKKLPQGAEAFERLARIATGLESRILGELEILGQVRNAYKAFQGVGESRDMKLDRMIQDALGLARKARRESGIDKNLRSLSSLAAQILLNAVPTGEPIAVIGSGSIAANAAKYLYKRDQYPIRIASRCPDRAAQLAMKIGGFSTAMDGLLDALKDVAGIVCATAAPHPVIFPHHLEVTQRPLHIVDLSVPPDCNEDVPTLKKTTYISLEQVEKRAQVNTCERAEAAKVAAHIIRDGVQHWAKNQ